MTSYGWLSKQGSQLCRLPCWKKSQQIHSARQIWQNLLFLSLVRFYLHTAKFAVFNCTLNEFSQFCTVMWQTPQSKYRPFPGPWSSHLLFVVDRCLWPTSRSNHWPTLCHYSSAFPRISNDRIVQYFVILVWFVWLSIIFLRLHPCMIATWTHTWRCSVKLCCHFLWANT